MSSRRFERQPIETYVLEYDEGIVSEAIRKELARGGQVYYLHNRVDNIEECAARVGKLVARARIGIAHGKMTEEQIFVGVAAIVGQRDRHPCLHHLN